MINYCSCFYKRGEWRIQLNGDKEYAIILWSKQDTKNTTYYGKNEIKFYKNRLEVRDNEGHPIRQCDKFKETSNSSQILKKDIEKMEDNVLNHTKQSSEDRGNYHEFKNRYKKSKS